MTLKKFLSKIKIIIYDGSRSRSTAFSDQLFKELIQTFFWEFIELFIPEVLQYVLKETSIFFPEEVFTDVTAGEKRK